MQTYARPVLAYRIWNTLEDGALASTGKGGTRWRPGANTAYCREGQHAAPAKNCHCGFNAFFCLDDALNAAGKNQVVGAVALRGALQIHAAGVRGEEAVILGLVNRGPRAEKAGDLYQVPVLDDETLAAQCQQVAAPVPVSERPVLSEYEKARQQNELPTLLRKIKTLPTPVGFALLLLTMVFIPSLVALGALLFPVQTVGLAPWESKSYEYLALAWAVGLVFQCIGLFAHAILLRKSAVVFAMMLPLIGTVAGCFIANYKGHIDQGKADVQVQQMDQSLGKLAQKYGVTVGDKTDGPEFDGWTYSCHRTSKDTLMFCVDKKSQRVTVIQK